MDSHESYRRTTWNWNAVDLHSHSTLDTLLTTFYFLLVLGIGLWAIRSHSRDKVRDFFLASKSLAWWLIGTSLFAANTGSGHFIGMAGLGAASGIAVGALEWNTIFMLFILGWIFIPIYIKAEVVTLPEYLRKRFGSIRLQMLLSILFLIVCVFNRILLEICYGATFLKMVWDIDIYQTSLVVLTIAGVYTITGGLIAVAYVEALQAGIMIFGSVLLMGYAFSDVGGYQGLLKSYFHAIPKMISKGNWTAKTACYIPRPDAFHIFQDRNSGDIPWPALVFGATSLSLFYGCADQVSVQRFLAGKNMSHMKGGCLLYGYLMLLPMFLIVMPGMISRTLFPDEVACVVPSECQKYCGAETTCSLLAYPMLVTAVLPTGLQGLMVSTICAALMSSLTSAFNSASALFTMNIYLWMRPLATEMELMVSGRFFTIILLVATITWIPILETAHSEKLFEHMQIVRSFLAPPITALFLLAVFCKRVNEQGAFWGVTLGISIGIFRLLAEFADGTRTCEGNSKCPEIICGLHHLYFSMILFLLSLLSILGISLITDPILDKHLHRLCWSLRNSQKKRVALDPEMLWRKFHSSPVLPERFRKGHSCLWNTLDLFCGLQSLPEPKSAPGKVTEKNMKATEKTRDTEWGDDTLEKPFWRRVVNVGGIILFVLLVVGHIYYA